MTEDKLNCCQNCRSIEVKKKPTLFIGLGMLLCNECGNKRCPKALNHNYLCTDSNEPNQICTLILK